MPNVCQHEEQGELSYIVGGSKIDIINIGICLAVSTKIEIGKNTLIPIFYATYITKGNVGVWYQKTGTRNDHNNNICNNKRLERSKYPSPAEGVNKLGRSYHLTLITNVTELIIPYSKRGSWFKIIHGTRLHLKHFFKQSELMHVVGSQENNIKVNDWAMQGLWSAGNILLLDFICTYTDVFT